MKKHPIRLFCIAIFCIGYLGVVHVGLKAKYVLNSVFESMHYQTLGKDLTVVSISMFNDYSKKLDSLSSL